MAAGENLGVNARALSERFTAGLERVEQLSKLGPADLVDALLPLDTESLCELRATALVCSSCP